MQYPSKSDEETQITGIYFDCKNKATGFYRDTFFCDIFHVCVGQKQKKTYSCPQINDQFYFDDSLKRCEFTERNPAGCLSNNYYRKVLTSTPVQVTREPLPSYEDVAAWKQYVRLNEAFLCSGKPDGFYSSRWCNVFYRCNGGFKYEFLCAKQQNGERLWWIQHSSTSEQAPDQESAHCAFPCDINRECASPGGVLIESNNSITESTAEVTRIINECNGDRPQAQAQVTHKIINDLITTKTTTAALPVETGDESSEDIFRLPNTQNTCAGVQGTLFQEDTNYCNVFHVCYGGIRKDFLCAKASHNQYELWWNSEASTCDWPCKVKCFNKKVYGSTNTPFEIQAFDFKLNGVEDCVNRNKHTINTRNTHRNNSSSSSSNSSFLNLIGNLGK